MTRSLVSGFNPGRGFTSKKYGTPSSGNPVIGGDILVPRNHSTSRGGGPNSDLRPVISFAIVSKSSRNPTEAEFRSGVVGPTHGPIALIDETMPVIVIAPHDRVFEKTVSNMQEVAARGGRIILITDPKGAKEATIASTVTLTVPEMPSTVTPLVYAIPVQLIAYHTAVIMGTDVDQPRNLAKSVTVE